MRERETIGERDMKGSKRERSKEERGVEKREHKTQNPIAYLYNDK